MILLLSSLMALELLTLPWRICPPEMSSQVTPSIKLHLPPLSWELGNVEMVAMDFGWECGLLFRAEYFSETYKAAW